MIKILHAYPDLMNIYGDYANVTLLRRRLADAGYDVHVGTKTVGGELDLTGYELLYFGAGTEGALLRALDDMERWRETVQSYVGGGGHILATGNAMALLGGAVRALDGTERQGVGLIDREFSIRSDRRYGEYVLKSDLCETPVIGAINTSLDIQGATQPLFQVDFSTKSGITGMAEGAHANTVYATQLTGPLLVRNPALLDAVAAMLAGQPMPPCAQDWYIHAVAGHARALETLRAEQAKRR